MVGRRHARARSGFGNTTCGGNSRGGGRGGSQGQNRSGYPPSSHSRGGGHGQNPARKQRGRGYGTGGGGNLQCSSTPASIQQTSTRGSQAHQAPQNPPYQPLQPQRTMHPPLSSPHGLPQHLPITPTTSVSVTNVLNGPCMLYNQPTDPQPSMWQSVTLSPYSPAEIQAAKRVQPKVGDVVNYDYVQRVGLFPHFIKDQYGNVASGRKGVQYVGPLHHPANGNPTIPSFSL
jgi:hypothetical protein